MIAKAISFHRSLTGRILIHVLIFGILNMAYGCVAYRQVPIPKDDFMSHKRIKNNLAGYSWYVHDGATTYKMENVQLVQNTDISGTLTATQFDAFQKEWKGSAKRHWYKAHKYDIHVFTTDNASLANSLQQVEGVRKGDALLKDAMIREIHVMGIDLKKSITVGNIALGVLLVYLGVFLVSVVVGIANGTGSDSGGSDSGGSDSGASDSGGSDSDSDSGS